eukprot:TRINITY_DN3184_c0_g1_i1.p1 TRINITY_DN3184_c0_g1~~TRINITY_DN3184_c0_g1_i1.p1  ORF type:complete len:556 (+),score=146.55 TRINITY_DN3184_c0_g1_i1:2-1669(+)
MNSLRSFHKKKKEEEREVETQEENEKRIKLLSGPSEIPENEIQYDINEVLGTGTFGRVVKGKCREVEVAIKIPNKQNFTPKQLEAFKKEMSIWSRLYHPNICLFMGASLNSDKVLIVTEKLEGDLETLIKNDTKLSLFSKMKMAKEAAQGIAWLHEQKPQKIIHRDIKTSNFLYDKSYRIKVCDFGLADLVSKTNQDMTGAKGTLLYMAPEVMLGQKFNEKADTYSFGIVLWELLTTKSPFENHTEVKPFMRAVALEGERPIVPSLSKCPLSLSTLMQECWDANITIRPSFVEICKRLDVVLIDSAIYDSNGNIFWKDNFFNRFEVPFSEFIEKFFENFGLEMPKEVYLNEDGKYVEEEEIQNASVSLINFRILQILFTTSPDEKFSDTVHIETFGKVLDCLGPLDDEAAVFLNRTRDVCSNKWFFGESSTQDTVSLLQKSDKKGAYIVRFGNQPNYKGYFVISKINSKNNIVHIRVKHNPGGKFSIDQSSSNKSFNSLTQLIEDSYKNPKFNLDKENFCLGSPFSSIWKQQQVKVSDGDGYKDGYDENNSSDIE